MKPEKFWNFKREMTRKYELQTAIRQLLKEKNAVLLVHNYQRGEIQEIADHLGDSLDLARRAAETEAEIIVFCGVRFMAETAKILSPQKMVLLPQHSAGCPMAETITAEDVRSLKKTHPGAPVVCYVNTTADVKAESDICCTSSNAVKIVEGLKANEVIFVPDRNLGSYVQRFTKKKIILWDGCCYVHQRMNVAEIKSAKKLYPKAELLVHPECPPDVVDLADQVLSTNGMVSYVQKSAIRHFLIGTEMGMIDRLKRENPDKKFHSAGQPKLCFNMKKTTLNDVYQSLRQDRFQVQLPEAVLDLSSRALTAMLNIA